jgi:hypothetical protein
MSFVDELVFEATKRIRHVGVVDEFTVDGCVLRIWQRLGHSDRVPDSETKPHVFCAYDLHHGIPRL